MNLILLPTSYQGSHGTHATLSNEISFHVSFHEQVPRGGLLPQNSLSEECPQLASHSPKNWLSPPVNNSDKEHG